MISCADFMTEIGNYLEGDVAEEVRRQLEGHLVHCSTCQVMVDSTRKTLRVVTDSGSFDLPPTVIKTLTVDIITKIRDGEKR